MKFPSISVITAGPALGHGCFIDATTLQQVLELGNENAPLKVFPDHNETVTDLIGAMSNFHLDGDQVRADLELIEENPLSGYYAKILDLFPHELGFSIAWNGGLEEIDGQSFARITELTSVDLVSQPAANVGGVYSAKIGSRKLKAGKASKASKVSKVQNRTLAPSDKGLTPEEIAADSLPHPVQEGPADVAETLPEVIEQMPKQVDSEILDTMSTDANPMPVTAEEALSAALAKALEPINAALSAMSEKLEALAAAEAQEVIGDKAEPMDEDEGMSAKLAEITAKLSVLETAATGSAPVAGGAFEQAPVDLAAAYEALSGKEQFAFAKKHFNKLRHILAK